MEVTIAARDVTRSLAKIRRRCVEMVHTLISSTDATSSHAVHFTVDEHFARLVPRTILVGDSRLSFRGYPPISGRQTGLSACPCVHDVSGETRVPTLDGRIEVPRESAHMPEFETHYVLVVHGTWNPPRDGERLWYQLDEANTANFCRQLNDRLDTTHIGRAVWRACDGEATDFAWSGANLHEDRIVAAKQLARRIVEISTKDPTARIHVVAHSHGGNVLLSAVQLYLSYLHFQSEIVWNFDSPNNRSRCTGYFEGEPETLSPLQLPPVKDFAVAFGLGNEELLLKRWRDARAEYQKDTATTDSPSEDEFRSWWIQSTSHNRLGRLVFLGTPFLYKDWGRSGQGRTRRWFGARWVNFLLDLLVWLPLFMLCSYVALQATWLVVAVVRFLFVGVFSAPRLSPLGWPFWVHLPWLLALTLALEMARKMTMPIRRTNLYCEDTITAYLILRHPIRIDRKSVV